MHGRPSISFEFFPPNTDAGKIKLEETSRELARLKPEFFSVTFGAGGSTRDRTVETVINIGKATQCDVAPHLSCISSSRDELRELLDSYRTHNIKRIIALRGDRPSGHVGAVGELHYANELVAFIRQHSGDYFHIEVAAYPEFHPETADYLAGINYFKRKVEAGANRAITQYFYNADAYFYFLDGLQKLDIEIPVIPGIMPITNFHGLQRFSNNCGAEIPSWLLKRLQAHADDEAAIFEIGLDVVTRLCEQLLAGGAPGLHFYTLNKAEPTKAICQAVFGEHSERKVTRY